MRDNMMEVLVSTGYEQLLKREKEVLVLRIKNYFEDLTDKTKDLKTIARKLTEFLDEILLTNRGY